MDVASAASAVNYIPTGFSPEGLDGSAADPARIYVIDDLPTNVALLSATLRRLAGVDVCGFTDSRLALVDAETRTPDLVLVDYQMPEMDGVEFITRFRELPGCASIPIVVVTGETEPNLLTRAFEAGAYDFLRKPVDRTELTVRVQCMLRLSEAHRRLNRLAREDELTGLANRRAFLEQLSAGVAQSSRKGLPFAIALFDIDHFKSINDRFGHAVGDDVLREVARRFKAAVRLVDCWGRIGGEEFALLLPCTEAEDALAACERVREAIADRPVEVSGGAPIAVTVSSGVAVNEPSDEVSTILARADEALYRAKGSGRNRVEASW